MKVNGKSTRAIWVEPDGWSVGIIDQTQLPHQFITTCLTTLKMPSRAIYSMQVRGAPLIGATAAYGVCLALRADASDASRSRLRCAACKPADGESNLGTGRSTKCSQRCATRPREQRLADAYRRAAAICEQDVTINQAIGRHGAKLIAEIAARKEPSAPVQVLTHCNAGWLATVDLGTALAPIYVAHDNGLMVHVWVDETRPRNQGAALTAWELGQHRVPHTVIADNTGGHLMQHGMVDLALVGTDRVTANGDVCNKIGTYLKALAAKDNGVPSMLGRPRPASILPCPMALRRSRSSNEAQPKS